MTNWKLLVEYVKGKHESHPFSGYDHVERVHRFSVLLAEGLDIDKEALEVAAYLHDIAVPVFGTEDHHIRASEVVGNLLRTVGLPSKKDDLVFLAIKEHTRYYDVTPTTLEGKILRDADGLDYIGSIGILRGIARGLNNRSYDGDVTKAVDLLSGLVKEVEGTFLTEKGIEIAQKKISFINFYLEDLKSEL